MIEQKNLKKTLKLLGFSEYGNIFEKSFPQFSCSLKVDFAKQKLIYPEQIKGRERNDGFDQKENFGGVWLQDREDFHEGEDGECREDMKGIIFEE